jgi:hypothetical protein
MTIAISMKVNDGLVLAADSASTIIASGDEGAPTVVNVYNNASKIANLRKGLPVGAVTWGAGSIGPASITTIMKDLRRRLSGAAPDHLDWNLDPASYSVEDIASRLREFVFEELYREVFGDWQPELQPPLGFIVAGYSTDAPMADEFQIFIANGECPPPQRLRPLELSGVTWNGEPEALTRLMLGFGTALPQVLIEHLGVADDDVPGVMEVLQDQLGLFLVSDAMPIQDAIDLAEFLVDLTIKVSRFSAGAPTVGGEIEIAAITKHEGFKWVRRKHYFSSEFNPREGLDA